MVGSQDFDKKRGAVCSTKSFSIRNNTSPGNGTIIVVRQESSFQTYFYQIESLSLNLANFLNKWKCEGSHLGYLQRFISKWKFSTVVSNAFIGRNRDKKAFSLDNPHQRCPQTDNMFHNCTILYVGLKSF